MTIICVQNLSTEKKNQYMAGNYNSPMIAFEKGIFELEELSIPAIKKVCEQYANAPELENDPLAFISESHGMKVSIAEDLIRLKLKEIMPAVYYSLYPMSQREIDAEYFNISDIIFIA